MAKMTSSVVYGDLYVTGDEKVNGALTVAGTITGVVTEAQKVTNALTVNAVNSSNVTTAVVSGYNGSAVKTLNIKAGDNITIVSDTSGNMTFSSTTVPIYTAGTGLVLNSTVFNHSNSITGGTVGSASEIPVITYDNQGHITSVSSVTVTITDNKVTTTPAATTKSYLTGTPTSTTSTSGLNFDTAVYLGETAGSLYAGTYYETGSTTPTTVLTLDEQIGKGEANGVASLDENGLVPSTQLAKDYVVLTTEPEVNELNEDELAYVINSSDDGSGTLAVLDANSKVKTTNLPDASTTGKGIVQTATQSEVNDGVETTKYITSAALAANKTYEDVNSTDPTIYEGVDLTSKFVDEISTAGNVWTWIKSRITAGNFKGIRVGDYIPFTTTDTNAYVIKAQIAGINTYKKTCDSAVGNHIDFISKDLYPQYIQWNTTNTNNGDATNANPFLASNIKTVLNDTILPTLPTELQNVIITKRWLLESRYSSSGTLTSSNAWYWGDLPKLWLPTEIEVYGHTALGTYNGYSIGVSIQYPIFANRSKIKGYGNGGSRNSWWLLTPSGSASVTVCDVLSYGNTDNDAASNTSIAEPLCFRIG